MSLTSFLTVKLPVFGGEDGSQVTAALLHQVFEISFTAMCECILHLHPTACVLLRTHTQVLTCGEHTHFITSTAFSQLIQQLRGTPTGSNDVFQLTVTSLISDAPYQSPKYKYAFICIYLYPKDVY